MAKPATTVAAILQQLVKTGREPHDKRDTLRRTIRAADNFKNAIIFCNRKREVAQLHRSLVRHGFNAAALHGDLDQSARTAALDAFRNGEVKLLIASDVAARGLDIPDVSHVFNFDVPHHADDYVHRIGRTGRAGKTGTAYHHRRPGRRQGGRRDREADRPEHSVGRGLPIEAPPTDAPTPRRSRTKPRAAPRRPRRRPPQASAAIAAPPRRPEHAPRAHVSLARRPPASSARAPPGRAVARIEEARHRQAPPRPREPADQDGGEPFAGLSAPPGARQGLKPQFSAGYLTGLLPVHEYRRERLSFAAAMI